VSLDFGSSNSFLSESVSVSLQGVSQTASVIKVKVANGTMLSSSTKLLGAEWQVQGFSFCSDLKILPLQSFDMILGMDWLEAFSLMKIH
jgi:hypothetical protein